MWKRIPARNWAKAAAQKNPPAEEQDGKQHSTDFREKIGLAAKEEKHHRASGSNAAAQRNPGSSACCWSNITPMANARMYPRIVLFPALGADTELIKMVGSERKPKPALSDVIIEIITTLYQNPFAILPIEAAAQATRG